MAVVDIFLQYFEGKPSGLNPVSIVRATPRFVDLRESITDAVLADFHAATEYVKVRLGLTCLPLARLWLLAWPCMLPCYHTCKT